MRVSKRADGKGTARPSELDAETARDIADGFLIDKVGDLLMAEEPRLSHDGHWVMSITASNVVQGTVGEVGTIAVDAATGEVLFYEEDRARLKARARELSGAPAL